MAVENPAPDIRKPKARRRKSGVVVPHKPTWYQRLGSWVVFLGFRTLGLTLRYTWKKGENPLDDPFGGPAIFCIWHNRLAHCVDAYHAYSRTRRTQGLAAMVSASRDGGLLAAILERFNVQPVRGSTSRRGPQALLELTSCAERGYDLAITPDGPRGPVYVVQEGVMSLAQLTGLPILPFCLNYQWKIQFKSWDRFQVPLPFSRCELRAVRPIQVPREASDAEREELRRKLEADLRSITVD